MSPRYTARRRTFALAVTLWIIFCTSAFWNVMTLGTEGNLELSISLSFMLTLAIIKMAEVLRTEVHRLI